MKLFCCIFILFVICLIQLSEGRGDVVKKCEKALPNKNNKVKEFLNFIKKYHRNYKTEKECVKRFNVFKENLKKAKEIQKTEKGTAVYGASIFADLTDKEFERYVGADVKLPKSKARVRKHKIPTEFDWREKGVVNPVRDQGPGHKTCFAFAAVGNAESVYAVKHKTLYQLSEQQIVDCHDDRTTHIQATEYLVKKGAMLLSDYPFVGNVSKCKYNPDGVVVKPDKAVQLPNDEEDMAVYLYDNGPITASVNSTRLQLYLNGVVDPEDCQMPTNHALVLVGYGIEESQNDLPFWILRNSWGEHWGEHGYVRLSRGKGTCCINSRVATAVFS